MRGWATECRQCWERTQEEQRQSWRSVFVMKGGGGFGFRQGWFCCWYHLKLSAKDFKDFLKNSKCYIFQQRWPSSKSRIISCGFATWLLTNPTRIFIGVLSIGIILYSHVLIIAYTVDCFNLKTNCASTLSQSTNYQSLQIIQVGEFEFSKNSNTWTCH